MFKRFAEWWKKKPEGAHRESEIVYDEYYNEHEKEWKYETTLVEDLEQIADLLSKEFPRYLTSSVVEMKYRGKIHFRTVGEDEQKIRREIKMKTLVIDNQWKSLEEIWWEADYEEYKKVYPSQYTEYTVAIKALRDCIKENYNNSAYHYIYSKYEDSINIVLNAIKDDKQNNDDYVSEEIFQKSKVIIDKLGRAVKEKQAEIRHVETLQKEAVQKSLIGRLDSELEYMEKFLEV